MKKNNAGEWETKIPKITAQSKKVYGNAVIDVFNTHSGSVAGQDYQGGQDKEPLALNIDAEVNSGLASYENDRSLSDYDKEYL